MELERLAKTLEVYDRVSSISEGTSEKVEDHLELKRSILEDPEIRPYDKKIFIGYLDKLGKESSSHSIWTYVLVGLLGAAGGFLARGMLEDFVKNYFEGISKKVVEKVEEYVRKN